jgi:cobalt-zinc-cadmium efflux system outer membrane protein
MIRLFSVALILLGGLVPAATVCVAKDISEADYLASFDASHPTRAVLDEDVGRARARVRDAGAWMNPVVGFEREAPGNITEDTWSFAWALPFDGRRSARKAAAEASLQAAIGERALAGVELRAALREAFAAWALATERRDILAASIERMRGLAARAQRQAAVGEASQLSAQRIALAVLEIESEVALADAERIGAHARATAWMLGDATELTPARPPLPTPETTPAPQETPGVGVRRAQLAAAEADRRASGRFIEFPELMVGWKDVDTGGLSESGPVFGVQWPLPLFTRQQGERDAADASRLAAQARLDIERRRMETRLPAATERYHTLRGAATRALASVAMGDEMIQSAVARFEAGESDVTELLETVRGVLSARFSALELYAAALAAHRELDLLTGRAWPMEDEE